MLGDLRKRFWTIGFHAREPWPTAVVWGPAVQPGDTVQVPDEVLQAGREEGLWEPQLTLRALYDLEGNLGETYVVADATRLQIGSRPLGGTSVLLAFALADVARMATRPDGLYVVLEMTAAAQLYRLRFSVWDQPELERLVALWRAAAGGNGASPGPARAEPSVAALHGPLPSPWILFCAALRAVTEADGHEDHGELEELARMIGAPDPIARGREFLSHAGIEGVLMALPAVLDPGQARCLLANALHLAMSDGWLRVAEQELIDRYAAALGVDRTSFDRICEVMRTRSQLAVFAEAAPRPFSVGTGDEPLTLFCAALQAMAAADGRVVSEEARCLARTLDDPEAWEQGMRRYASSGLGGLVPALAVGLSVDQRRCLLANLVSLALSDGLLRGAEQELLERFRAALGVTIEDYERFREVLECQVSLGILGPMPGA